MEVSPSFTSLVTIPGAGHSFERESDKQEIVKVLWEFFKQYL